MKRNLLTNLLVCLSVTLYCQVGINTDFPNESSIVDIHSTDKGVLFPRVTDLKKIENPAGGLVVFDTALKCLSENKGTPESPDWQCIGNTKDAAEYELVILGEAGGTLVLKKPVIRGSVVQTILVNVKKEGPYYFETERINGLRYVASGNFYPIDVQNSLMGKYPSIVLSAEGTPEKYGAFSFKFKYPESKIVINSTVNNTEMSLFSVLSSDKQTIYSRESYVLNATIMGGNTEEGVTYEWFENGQSISKGKTNTLKLSKENETPEPDGKYADKSYVYSCLITVGEFQSTLTNVYTVTVRPPWGQNENLVPGIEVQDTSEKLGYYQASEKCYSLGSGWRLPSFEEASKICIARIVSVCKITENSASKPQLWIGALTGEMPKLNNFDHTPFLNAERSIGNGVSIFYNFQADSKQRDIKLSYFCVRGY